MAQHCVDVQQKNMGRTMRMCYADPQYAFNKTAMNPKTIAMQAKECGILLTPGPRSTDIDAQVNAVRHKLNTGMIKVFRSCPNTITEFQTWAYKRNRQGEMLSGDDQFNDDSNDLMDGIRGLVTAGIQNQVPRSQVRGAGIINGEVIE